jgi:hypothetical protein
MSKSNKRRYWLLHVWRGIDIKRLGPYKSSAARTAAAKLLVASDDFDMDTDSIFWLDSSGSPRVGEYPGGLFENT